MQVYHIDKNMEDLIDPLYRGLVSYIEGFPKALIFI